MIQALIFDFDGLILDTETAWYESYQKVLKDKFQYDLSLDVFLKGVGTHQNVLNRAFQEAIGDHFDPKAIEEDVNLIHAEKIKHLDARQGVRQYLADAKQLGLKTAIATSSTRAWVTTHLTRLKLIDHFDILVTQDDVSQTKPAPDLYLKAMDHLQIQPEEGLAFEDSLHGFSAAKKANLKTVIVTNPVTARLPFKDYHRKFQSLEEMRLEELLQTLE